MVKTWEIEMVKGQVEKRFVFHSLVMNCFEEEEDYNIIYFDCIRLNMPSEIKVTYDKKGHWTNFDIEYRTEGYEDWHWLDTWESHIK